VGFFPRYAYKHWTKRFAAACFDGVGTLLSLPRHLFPSVGQTQIRRILVIRLDHLGDLVMTRPALAALHKRFPGAQIDLLIAKEFAPLLENAREIREIIPFAAHWFSKNGQAWHQVIEARAILKKMKQNHYDLAIDFRGDVRNILLMTLAGIPRRLGWPVTGGGFLLSESNGNPPESHQVLRNLDLLEPLGVDPFSPNVPFSYSANQKREFWNSIGKSIEQIRSPKIAVHAGAGYPSKRWPEKKFSELIRRILEKEWGSVILIGSAREKEMMSDLPMDPHLIDLRGKTAVEDLPILFDGCDFFLGNDSGPSHIAAAQDLECVVIFSGTNNADYWHPWTRRLRLVRYPVPCSPCEAQECPLDHHDCLEKITVDQVACTLKETLDSREEVGSK